MSISTVLGLDPWDSLIGFGNSLEAHRSVVTAIACFTSSPDDYLAVVTRAIGQGNDTDTLAAMAGAISGATMGISGIPTHLIDALEDQGKGRQYLAELAEGLHRQYIGHRKFEEEDSDRRANQPKHRWYQFSLLELLLVTTILCRCFGSSQARRHQRTLGRVRHLFVYGCYFTLTLGRLRRNCIENDLWFPDPVQVEDDSRREL